MYMATADLDQLRVERLAYLFWQQRGSPLGSPEEDWFRAERQLRIERRTAYQALYAFGIERTTR
jgi:hypothetical protein